MRASHRLDVLIVPDAPEHRPVDAAMQLLRSLSGCGVLLDDGRAGPEASRWMTGGFARIIVDDPGRVTLFANRQGGFRVRCPVTGRNLVPEFGPAITAWRAGGSRSLACPHCGQVHALEAVDAAPPLAMASLAVITVDASAAAPTSWALEHASSALGPVRTVLRRG